MPELQSTKKKMNRGCQQLLLHSVKGFTSFCPDINMNLRKQPTQIDPYLLGSLCEKTYKQTNKQTYA